MFKNVNQSILGGNLGADAEVREAGKSQVAKFRIANTFFYKKGDTEEKVETTHWFTIEYWNPGNLAPLLKKGTPVTVVGQLFTNTYENKESQKVTETIIKADQVYLNGGKKD